MKPNYKVITISRQYGAGGRSVAKGLSEKLGIPYFDKDFVKLTAENSGFSERDIIREGEDMSYVSKLVNKFLNNSASYASSHDAIFDAQVRTIIEIAQNPCIIVGRCSNVILNAADIPSFDIFLYADMEYKVQRAKEIGDFGNMDPYKYVEKRDNQRDIYYKMYTKHDPSKAEDYDICINTGVVGIENSVNMLYELLK